MKTPPELNTPIPPNAREKPERTMSGSASPQATPSKNRFWSRHSAIINFWLDTLLAILFLAQAWILVVLHIVFPRGAGEEWKVWGNTPLAWSEALFRVYCIFAIGIVLHVMFHWSWICGIVSTRIIGRKNRNDDGTQTLLGVGLLVLLLHGFALGILVARMGLSAPP